MSIKLNDLAVRIFADGADVNEIKEHNSNPMIKGLTTNPSLMRKAGVKNYQDFAKEVLSVVTEKPISFEVISDDLEEIERQAHLISTWGQNVFVKIPVTNSFGESTNKIIKNLTNNSVKVNVTAILTYDQVAELSQALNPKIPSFVSIFAGRIADTGQDPMECLTRSIKVLESNSNAQVIWASPRELLNIFQAEQIGCHVITVNTEILKKLSLINYDLNQYSLDTVKMFYEDAIKSGFNL
jgi:transaldolase